jgi:uncharacterized protein (DUF433 family)
VLDAKPIYLNTGIFSVPEAAKLTGVSGGRIRRWLKGYRYTSREKRYASMPLWRGQFQPINNKMALGFLDLIEVRFVEAFLRAGVSWDMIHKARDKAAERFPGESHPFCTQRFFTDGREIFVELHKETREPSLVEIVESQQVFSEIVRPFLAELEFGPGNILERWWPLGKEGKIAVDPKRNFGQPTVFEEGIPTRVLARSVKANGSVQEVARWYEVSSEAVREAVEFEQKLAA